MDTHIPSYRFRYSRMLPPDGESPQGARAHCEEAEADQCTISVGSTEFDFGRSAFDPERWDPALTRLERVLLDVFEQGRAAQRQIIRDSLGLPNAWGGDMHGRSGR